ncbi:hypothetical protein [Rhodobacter sp. TJ_12]|uniref:hypothetical protein n=1 Tax=Rhodobacter sp. TJ_12 TaxID=2029399 RepID=UPI001CBE8271|nr:hypothetical protein [Rhodobacter sp. TJ_12]
MTMTSANTGMMSAASHGHDEKKDYTFAMYIIAAVVIGIIATLVVTMGLGGLILFGVGATWFMLALLVVMTAGG